MRARDVARDRQSQSDAASLEVAPLIEPMKRPERLLAALLGYPRPVVVDHELDAAAGAFDADFGMTSVFQRILDQICQAALQRVLPDRDRQALGRTKRYAIAR